MSSNRRRSARCRRLASVAVLTVAVGIVLPAPATAAECVSPTVNALTYGESAVSRPAVVSPSEIPVSNVYSVVEQATFPEFTYAEAGPQYAGVFEALMPPGTPPPPRAVSAYPSEDIPDSDDETWGGRSHTEVTNTSALATSAGADPTPVGEARARSSRSWVVTDVECDVVTVVAGWEANDVTLGPGAFVEHLSQSTTIVVGPEGASADVETTVAGAEGVAVPSEGRPADPFTDPMREGGGPTLEAGEPRTEVGDDFATARGGGFHFLLTDPETGQGAGYAIGGVVATIVVRGPLSTTEPATTTSESTPGPLGPPARPAGLSTVVGTAHASTGSPPAPAPVVVDTAAAVRAGTIVEGTVSLVTAERLDWLPLFGLVGFAAVAATMIGAVHVGRDDYPTLDWIARKATGAGSRFSAVYLRW